MNDEYCKCICIISDKFKWALTNWAIRFEFESAFTRWISFSSKVRFGLISNEIHKLHEFWMNWPLAPSISIDPYQKSPWQSTRNTCFTALLSVLLQYTYNDTFNPSEYLYETISIRQSTDTFCVNDKQIEVVFFFTLFTKIRHRNCHCKRAPLQCDFKSPNFTTNLRT